MSIPECYKERFLTTAIGFCTAAIVIPLYELIIYPTIRKILPKVIIIIAFDLMARKTYTDHHNQTTVQCIFSYDLGALSSSFNGNGITAMQLLDIPH